MTNVDSQRIKEIRDNTKAMAEAFSRIANTLADALELYISTQTETQNSNLTFEKDECAKEYEELGLKELKELIEVDRKTEPTISKMEQVEDELQTNGYQTFNGTSVYVSRLEDEPQTQLTAKCLNCVNGGSYKCTKCDGEMYFKRLEPKDEPKTERRE